MLQKGGFTLRKWLSNHPALLEHLPPEEVEIKMLMSFGNEDVIKALGLLWNSTTHKLIFCVQLNQDNTPTKRSVLRAIASIYDPLTCFRLKATTATQLTGQLPEVRVKPSKPFTNSGVDYSGPFYVKQGGKRSKTMVKCYIALFICLSTKAIHLELISELSAEAYTASLRSFIARRGLCNNIYSDNGTNFVGAEKELKKIISEEESTMPISNFAAQQGINFDFIPPSSPHMGGIWEAGVRSMKFHLCQVVGNTKLTFEEFYTLLSQVEAVLNSRPICSLSNNPDNIPVLTPGHFLIGTFLVGSRDSVVSIATCYGLEGPGIESRWGEIFRIYPDRLRGPPSLLYNGYRVFPGGKGGRGMMLTTHPLLVLRLRKS